VSERYSLKLWHLVGVHIPHHDPPPFLPTHLS
jgi:hypothetical protein